MLAWTLSVTGNKNLSNSREAAIEKSGLAHKSEWFNGSVQLDPGVQEVSPALSVCLSPSTPYKLLSPLSDVSSRSSQLLRYFPKDPRGSVSSKKPREH